MDKLPSTFKFIRLLGWLYISFLALISIFYFGVYVNSDTGLTIEYFVIFIIEIAFVAIGVRYFIAGFSKILIYTHAIYQYHYLQNIFYFLGYHIQFYTNNHNFFHNRYIGGYSDLVIEIENTIGGYGDSGF